MGIRMSLGADAGTVRRSVILGGLEPAAGVRRHGQLNF